MKVIQRIVVACGKFRRLAGVGASSQLRIAHERYPRSTHMGNLSVKRSILSDRRVERTRRHSLTNIMVTAISAL